MRGDPRLMRAAYEPWNDRRALKGADDPEGPADEDVMRPVDADHVDVVLAVAQQRDTIDGPSGIGRHRSALGPVRCCAGDDRARPFAEVRRDLADTSRRARIAAVERNHLAG